MDAIYKKWEWELASSSEELWPLVANTDRFNFDLGLPPREDITGDAPLENARQFVRFSRYGLIDVEFQQEPFEWVRPHRYGFERIFSQGPLTHIKVRTTMLPRDEEGGTSLTYEVWATPRNALGKLLISIDLNLISGRKLNQVFERYDAVAGEWHGVVETSTNRLTPGGAERLATLCEQLIERTGESELAEKLADLIKTADTLSLADMRPYEIADYWGVERRRVLELFLIATQLGMLVLQWDLLCPMCRGSGARHESLSTVENDIHCDSCRIDFTVNFDQSVEITFRPVPALREIGTHTDFCISGPYRTPHIISQQLLQPGEERSISPIFEEGGHRVRTLKNDTARYFRIGKGHKKDTITIPATVQEWKENIELPKQPTLHLVNNTDDEQLFFIERTAWSDRAVTAAEVTTMQTFRNLFAEEALRPGERISVRGMTLLFTDLRSSTTMYNTMGDAPAFGIVMRHFDVMRDIIDRHEGAIVKTIGDAVMGAFQRPVNALQAALEAQERLAGDDPTLTLKAGINYGPCIAVNLNDRLDYFGTTVNIAARLEPLSTGEGVIISDAARSDHEVEALLQQNTNLHAEPLQVTLKGYEGDEFRVWVIRQQSLGR